MPIMEGGLFTLMAVFGFIFLILSFRIGALLKAVSAVMFFSLALILMSGYEVAYTTELFGAGSNDCSPEEPCIERNYLVRINDETGKTDGDWLAWVFIIIGILSSMLFIVEMLPR